MRPMRAAREALGRATRPRLPERRAVVDPGRGQRGGPGSELAARAGVERAVGAMHAEQPDLTLAQLADVIEHGLAWHERRAPALRLKFRHPQQ